MGNRQGHFGVAFSPRVVVQPSLPKKTAELVIQNELNEQCTIFIYPSGLQLATKEEVLNADGKLTYSGFWPSGRFLFFSRISAALGEEKRP
jgi:hypothetical protein